MQGLKFVVIAAASLALLTAADAQDSSKGSKRAADVQTAEQKKKAVKRPRRDSQANALPDVRSVGQDAVGASRGNAFRCSVRVTLQ